MKHNFSFTPSLLRQLGKLTLLTITAGAAQAQTFALQANPPTTGASDAFPFNVVTADVNGDGKRDALVCNNKSGTLAVMLGNGMGGFALQANSPATGGSTFDLAVGDVNKDGKADVVTANYDETSKIGILLGNGAGGFTLQANSPSSGTNTRPTSVALADVNGDGNPDILTANNSSNTIGILLGDGRGNFTLQANSPATGGTSSYGPAHIVVADVNKDGKLDALVVNLLDGTLSVLLGNGAGRFTLQANSPSTGGSQPRRLAVVDVNGDDNLDVLVANSTSSSIGVLFGNGKGGFTLQANLPSTGPGTGPYGMAVADIDSDGKLDVVAADFSGNTLRVLRGNGAGGFTLQENSPSTGGSQPWGVTLADVNGDGLLDALTTNRASATMGVLLATLPTPPTATNTSRCGAGTVTLQASGATAGGSYRWYTAATGGVAINGATGSAYTTPVLYGTTTYYVSSVNASGSNETTRTAVTATITYALPPTIVAGGPTVFNSGGSVTLTARPNLALKLDGSSQYVSTNLDAQPSALPTTTWEAWIYPTRTNYGLRQTLMGIDDGAWDRGVLIEANTANFAVFTGTGTIWQPTTVDLNTWQHIAVVYTATGITFYKNGVPYTYDTSQGYALGSTVNKLHIGHNPGFGEYFQGQVDEARVWNYQRTQEQIQAGMFAVPAGTTAGLVGSWSFNEGSGAVATDATSKYAGSLISAPAYVTPGQSSITSAYTWTPSAGLSSSTAQTVTAAPGTTTTYTVAVNDNTGCAQTASQTVTVYADLVVSTAGQTVAAGTYNSITVRNGGVATLGGAVTVNGAVTVQAGGTLNTNCQALTGAGSFTLEAGGTLGICDLAGIAASGSTGAVQLAGTRSFSPDASYVYNGGDSQITGSGLPSQVRSFTTTNASTVRLSNPLRVSQVLTVAGRGNFDLNGQALTLLSGKTGSALVVNSGTGVVSGGTATVQRYLDPTFNTGSGYRHYSAPVSGSTVADLATTTGFTPVVNINYNTSAAPGTVTPFPNVFGYDQSRLSSSTSNYSAFEKGFFSPSDLTDELLVGQGYVVQIGADQLVDFTGQLNTGDKTLSLTRNADATAPDAGWALVGNPYPAPLDWSQVAAADRTNLDGSIYVVQSSGPYTGSYRAYVNNVAASGTNSPLIGTGQGFFVRVSSGQTSGSLTFRNSQRVTDYASQAAVYRTTADLRPLVQLELRTSAGQADGIAIYAEAGATASYDTQYDAGKLANSTGLNLASLSAANQPLAIDGRPAFTPATVVPLTVGVPAAGTYSLAVAALHNLPAGLDAFLTDAQTGQTVRLGQQSAYSFSVTATESLALLTGRFTLSFSAAAPLATTPAPRIITEVALYPNPASEQFTVQMPAVAGASQVQATLLNALGQVVRRQAAALPTAGATLTVETAGLPTGVYTLRLQAGATTTAKRVLIK